MDRIRQIQMHPFFQELVQNLQQAEKGRIFCRHTMEHFLDTARLMYIYNLEDGAPVKKDIIYAAALLHDLGRFEQLQSGTPHEAAGAEAAEKIMQECGFAPEEILEVKKTILHHRSKNHENQDSRLASYLYQADKKSRLCFSCPAKADCNWPEEKKNLWIEY